MSFIRKYEIIFGAPFKIVDENKATGTSVYDVYKVDGKFVSTSDLDDYLSSNAKTFYKIQGDLTESLTGLEIQFDILKKAKKSNKTSNLTIYNLSDKIVSYLKQNEANNIVLSLKAGYADEGMKVIFKGTVSQVIDKWEGADRQTKLKLQDGALHLREAFSNVSYKKGTKVDTIISDLLSDFGLPKDTGKIVKFGDSETINNPYYFVGNTKDGLTAWERKYKINASIQDGQVVCVPYAARVKNSVLTINQDSGLVGNIVPANKNSGTLSLDTVSKVNTYKFKILLNGAVTPESTVMLDTDDYSDMYLKVTSVEHKGDYESGEWVTEITGTEVDNVMDPDEDYTPDTN